VDRGRLNRSTVGPIVGPVDSTAVGAAVVVVVVGNGVETMLGSEVGAGIEGGLVELIVSIPVFISVS
jgi:hypothetical protein